MPNQYYQTVAQAGLWVIKTPTAMVPIKYTVATTILYDNVEFLQMVAASQTEWNFETALGQWTGNRFGCNFPLVNENGR